MLIGINTKKASFIFFAASGLRIYLQQEYSHAK